MMTKTKYLGFALKYSKEKREQKEGYMNQKENIIFYQSTICRHLPYLSQNIIIIYFYYFIKSSANTLHNNILCM